MLFWSVSWSPWTTLSKTGRWSKCSSNFCFLSLGKIYPTNAFCTTLPRDRQVGFPAASGYRILQCRFAHFSACIFSQIARIHILSQARCWEKAPLQNFFCREYRKENFCLWDADTGISKTIFFSSIDWLLILCSLTEFCFYWYNKINYCECRGGLRQSPFVSSWLCLKS